MKKSENMKAVKQCRSFRIIYLAAELIVILFLFLLSSRLKDSFQLILKLRFEMNPIIITVLLL